MCPDLLGTEALQGRPEGIPDGKSQQTSAHAVDAAQGRHRVKAPSGSLVDQFQAGN
jgi:hypothetical protein